MHANEVLEQDTSQRARLASTAALLGRSCLVFIGLQAVLAAQGGTVVAFDEITVGTGGFSGSMAPGDRFGSALASLGDLNGDGFADVAVCAPGDDELSPNTGAVWILLLDAAGKVSDQRSIKHGDGGIQLNGASSFASSVAAVGDLDGDGVTELAIGQPSRGAQPPATTLLQGAVWIVFMNPDGSARSSVLLQEGINGVNLGIVGDAARLGSSLATLGDLDGDGVPDLAVGADQRSQTSNNKEGAVFLLLLRADGSVKDAIEIAEGRGGFTGSLGSRYRFGSALTNLGDLDGDGVNDLAVGQDHSGTVLLEAGAVWILFMNADGTVRSHQKIDGANGGLGVAFDAYSRFGASLATLPDLDGNGIQDLFVGALGTTAERGEGWLLFLQADGIVTGELNLTETSDELAGEMFPDDDFGAAGLAFVSTDGDRYPELFVGRPDPRTFQTPTTGSVFVLDLCVSALTPDFSAQPSVGSHPLAVAFQDLTTGGVPESWAWDFGDGGRSTLQDPTYVYATAGTYDVSLRVESSTGICLLEKRSLVQVVPPFVSISSRNGSGINPEIYLSSDLPVLGTTWSAEVDATLIGGATGLTFLLGYEGALSGLPSTYGEVLIDFTSDFVLLDVASFSADKAQHDLAVPGDLSLSGFAFSTQVLINSQRMLTNALDLTLGY